MNLDQLTTILLISTEIFSLIHLLNESISALQRIAKISFLLIARKFFGNRGIKKESE